MLYDNAQLAQVLLRAYQATGKAFYRGVAEGRWSMSAGDDRPEGGFYSAQDADSEGVEGKFFVWTPDEIRAVLGEREAESSALLRCDAPWELEEKTSCGW